MIMTNVYYAAVDKDGSKNIFLGKPRWHPRFNHWFGTRSFDANDLPGFPSITWDDEPKLVRLTIEVINEEDK